MREGSVLPKTDPKFCAHSGLKRPWQLQTWQDLTRFSPLDFSLLSPDFRGLVLLNCTEILEKKLKIQWRASNEDGAPKLQISVPCRGRTCPEHKSAGFGDSSAGCGEKREKMEKLTFLGKALRAAQRTSGTVFSTESASVVFYYSVVNLLRVVIHYSKYSKSAQNVVIHYIFSSESLRVVNSLQIANSLLSGLQKGPEKRGRAKIVEKCRKCFWHFLTFFALRENCRKVSKNFLTLFDDFWRFLTFFPFRRPLLQSAELRVLFLVSRGPLGVP